MLESDVIQAVTISRFLFAMTDGNSTCCQVDGCKSDHKSANVWRMANGSVLIYNPSGCMCVMLDHSGNVLSYQPSTLEDGVNRSYPMPNLQLSNSEKPPGLWTWTNTSGIDHES